MRRFSRDPSTRSGYEIVSPEFSLKAIRSTPHDGLSRMLGGLDWRFRINTSIIAHAANGGGVLGGAAIISGIVIGAGVAIAL